MDDDYLYCTWGYRGLLSPEMHGRFRDLDQFLRDLIASAQSHVIVVAPYASPAGIGALKGALAASAQRGAWIRFVIGETQDADSWNRRALKSLVEGQEGVLIRGRLRVLVAGPSLPVLFHAKAIAVDGDRGYLGSANLSWRGMEQNFEVGVSLGKNQARSIHDLVTFLEARGLLVDQTGVIEP